MTTEAPRNRWLEVTGGTRGPAYAERFRRLAAEGRDMHGEARFCDALLPRGARVLDAGCGTGRLGTELARRGHVVVGVDIDASMVGEARAEAPELTWLVGDLAELDPREVGGPDAFDLAVAAGNVMVYLTPGTLAAVLGTLAACVTPAAGLVVAGFALDGGNDGLLVTPDAYDAACAAAGLEPVDRFAGWDREEWDPAGEYGVFVHRRR
ncbi:class I SAM-dependent methyltransferase [Yinghuangia seranimata]|uniref:class I SAM-dependent methyltransferase n=1 Tax=Yinghuangia seranimata TaxID=408067 RepID=UPI00248BA47B|nr:methyltransferase domain-containing protein [Yinghuangia seranimata]MDI2128925.1 methyltransferase domain-containing protein [Yinghuangia seranimata]